MLTQPQANDVDVHHQLGGGVRTADVAGLGRPGDRRRGGEIKLAVNDAGHETELTGQAMDEVIVGLARLQDQIQQRPGRDRSRGQTVPADDLADHIAIGALDVALGHTTACMRWVLS